MKPTRRRRGADLDTHYLRWLQRRLGRAQRIAEVNRRIALTDPLTGLPNRRHLRCYLDQAMARGIRRPLSLAIFDVDDFKTFNDRHGHVVGDEALVSVGRVLSSVLSRRFNLDRCLGLTARLGGDEFVVVCPGKTAGEARNLARRLAASVARHPALARSGVTVSFGVASRDAGMRRHQELLAAADRDLYRHRSVRRAATHSRPAAAFGTLSQRSRAARAIPRGSHEPALPHVAPAISAMNPSRKAHVDLRELEHAAEELARSAGEVALGYFGTRVEVETKPDDTPVTVADRETESLLRAGIQRRFPEHGIFGEEHGEVRRGAPVRWILDPIDGTRSFVRGVPLWGVLIGIEVEGEPVVGVVHLPALGETVTAARGLGCRWNGKPCRVSRVGRLGRSLVLTSDETAFHGHPAEAGWRDLAAAARMTRSWGDCYGHVLVATGRAQAMVDPVLASWDAAPFLTILTEAGGCFTDMSGTPTIHGGSAISSNPALHPRVLELLGKG